VGVYCISAVAGVWDVGGGECCVAGFTADVRRR